MWSQTSQLIEVITWRSGHPTLIHSLRAHTRVITDIDWHMKHPHLLASCSIDTFTHLWDLRDPRKPILSLSAVCMCKIVLFSMTKIGRTFLFGLSWCYTSRLQQSVRKFAGNSSRWRLANLGSENGLVSHTVHNCPFVAHTRNQLEPLLRDSSDDS